MIPSLRRVTIEITNSELFALKRAIDFAFDEYDRGGWAWEIESMLYYSRDVLTTLALAYKNGLPAEHDTVREGQYLVVETYFSAGIKISEEEMRHHRPGDELEEVCDCAIDENLEICFVNHPMNDHYRWIYPESMGGLITIPDLIGRAILRNHYR
jgi:hypothetical protein